jgi:hypothetical protein
MPAGLPYFAWIDASETTFGAEHMRWDEAVFSFTLKQEEGDPASLTAVVRRPQDGAGNTIGLLGPGRKIWVWFALDCGPGLVKFRGRLVGIPTSIFEDLVTLEFVAKPIDLVAQKEALADTLRVLPYYDEAVIDKSRRNDPDVVLEGYTKIWHYDRESGPASLTISDEITGEDGLVEFDGESEDGKVLYDGLGLKLTSGPLSRVDVSAEYTWTQQARGTVDLTGYLMGIWSRGDGVISLNAGDWPKPGGALGDGWEVADATATDLWDFTVQTVTTSSISVVKWPGGEESKPSSHTTTVTHTATSVAGPQVGVGATSKDPPSTDTFSVSHGKDGDGHQYVSGYSRSISRHSKLMVIQQIHPTLVAGYKAERPFTERVSFSLFADVQPILTDPEDGEALRIDDIKSVNLSDPDEGILIGDPRRRSYIATERGNQSLEHLIALARAKLMLRARAVEITFAPKLARMPEITLRKNAFLVEPRVGEALGKIIGYSIALDGSDGRVNCEVRIGCTIGRGGSAVATGGTPTYCSIDYVGFDYQQFIGRTVLFDSSVGYEPPISDPNDDGINFMAGVSVSDVIEIPLVIHSTLLVPVPIGHVTDKDESQITATFKLKSMTREFSTDYEVQLTDLQVPSGYDLEAA